MHTDTVQLVDCIAALRELPASSVDRLLHESRNGVPMLGTVGSEQEVFGATARRPNFPCVVSNLVDSVWLVGGGEVLDRLDVSARGRIA